MIMSNIPTPIKCPKCQSENVTTKWSLTIVMAWIGRLSGVRTVKIFEKKCAECGHKFQIFRKYRDPYYAQIGNSAAR